MTGPAHTNTTTAAEVVAKVINEEGGAPGSSLHSWRCEYPDRYGECSCVAETAEEIVKALRTAGLLAVSGLPIPADDDAPCPRCGCPTACPEGRMEALSAELAEAKAEVERLTAECYRAWNVAVEERLRRLEAEAGIESPPEPEPDPLAGRLPLQVEYGLVWDDLGSADTFPTLEQARAAARGFDEPAQVVRIETWPVADEGAER